MRNINFNIRIKFYLFLITLVCALTFFSINWYLVNQFRNELNKQVKTVINIYHNELINDKIDSDYLLKTITPLIDDLDIPMIISTKKTNGELIYEHINLNFKYSNDNKLYDSELHKIVKLMDKNNVPLTLWPKEGPPIIQLHYGDSIIINNLRWISYIEFGFIFFVILLFALSIYLIFSNEKNYIYVGMAREAAHQLGTPISSLMGWLKLLENNDNNREQIYSSMTNDINKLNDISNKFNKIGSIPKLKKINLVILINEIIEYYSSKLPKSGNVKILLNESYNNSFYVKGDKVLLYWAIENIVKNSIDAIDNTNGKIILSLSRDSSHVIIEIKDNGKGISRKNKNNIFKPGFSTKIRGWGLGLNLSKRIIEKIHRGSIILLKAKQNNTIFRIKLISFVS